MPFPRGSVIKHNLSPDRLRAWGLDWLIQRSPILYIHISRLLNTPVTRREEDIEVEYIFTHITDSDTARTWGIWGRENSDDFYQDNECIVLQEMKKLSDKS